MKAWRFIIAIGIVSQIGFAISCKKKEGQNNGQNQTPQGTKLTYAMDTVLNTFVLISYNDETGKKVDITDWEKFSGSKTIYINKKPFNALFRTESNNPNNVPVHHLMYIMVNDSIKTYKSCATPANSTGTVHEVSFVVP